MIEAATVRLRQLRKDGDVEGLRAELRDLYENGRLPMTKIRQMCAANTTWVWQELRAAGTRIRKKPTRTRIPTMAPLRPQVLHLPWIDAERLPAWDLSLREAEILSWLAVGLRYKQIATTLRISLNTVKTQVKRILRKLGVGDSTSAVYVACHYGLLVSPATVAQGNAHVQEWVRLNFPRFTPPPDVVRPRIQTHD